jgi:hypothetical protein
MSRITRKKYGVIAGVTAILLLVGGVAFAYWTSTGTGSATGTTGTDTPFDISVTNTTNATLTPGGPTDTYSYTITNGGSGHQELEAQPTITITNDQEGAGCDSAWYAVTPTPVSLADLGPGASATSTFDVQLTNLPTTNQDACKGATVTATVTVP